MILQQFLTVTATTPGPVLRRAIATALSVESPKTPEAYDRFYCRVLGELGVTLATDCLGGASGLTSQTRPEASSNALAESASVVRAPSV